MSEHSDIAIDFRACGKSGLETANDASRFTGLDRGEIQHRAIGRVGDIVRASCKHAEWNGRWIRHTFTD